MTVEESRSSSRSGRDGPLLDGPELRPMCAAFSSTLYISAVSRKVLPTWRVGLSPQLALSGRALTDVPRGTHLHDSKSRQANSQDQPSDPLF